MFSLSGLRDRLLREAEAHGEFAVVVVDTSAAFFEGDNENDNVHMGRHARMLRSLRDLPGAPTVLVTCHPTKTADPSRLLPRGGGAFLAEVDGNLVCVGQPGGGVVDLHWHDKLRGPGFPPIPFKIRPGKTPNLLDSKGREMWTVTAEPISEALRAEADDKARADRDDLLIKMRAEPALSLRNYAQALEWTYSSGKPDVSRANRTMKKLEDGKLAKNDGDGWTLTRTGNKAAAEAEARLQEEIPF